MLAPYELDTDAYPPVVEVAVDLGALGVIRVFTNARRSDAQNRAKAIELLTQYPYLGDEIADCND